MWNWNLRESRKESFSESQQTGRKNLNSRFLVLRNRRSSIPDGGDARHGQAGALCRQPKHARDADELRGHVAREEEGEGGHAAERDRQAVTARARTWSGGGGPGAGRRRCLPPGPLRPSLFSPLQTAAPMPISVRHSRFDAGEIHNRGSADDID